MIKCIAIDDEPLALEVIENHISKVEQLELVGTFTNPLKAFSFLKENEVELIFLDIQMPELSGLDLLKLIPKRPHVILTTAYSEYALEGYELDVSDYLLKPILFERFFKAINKVEKYMALEFKEAQSGEAINQIQSNNNFIFVKTEYKTVKVNLDEILYIEGWKDYVKIHLKEEVILSLLSIRVLEQQLSESMFLRVHRSFIVAHNAIESIERNRIYINGNWIPVGGSYKEVFQSWLGSYKIG